VYIYNGISVEKPDKITFKDVDWNDKPCFDFVIKNLNTDTLYLGSILLKDSRLKITTFPALPEFLAQNMSVNCRLCFEPNTDITALLDSLELVINCGKLIYIPVEGNVIAPNIDTRNLDFGNVKVGTTKCDSLWFVNKGIFL